MYKALTQYDHEKLTAFFVSHCPNKNSTCKTGTPFPKDACRLEDSEEEPCKWYVEGKGCTHKKHPRNKKGWKE